MCQQTKFHDLTNCIAVVSAKMFDVAAEVKIKIATSARRYRPILIKACLIAAINRSFLSKQAWRWS